jgi:hypothetical protein
MLYYPLTFVVSSLIYGGWAYCVPYWDAVWHLAGS